MAEVVASRIRLPLFSVANPESFQIMLSLPLPQPSTLVGALAYAIGVWQGEGVRAYERVLSLAEEGRLAAARARIHDPYGLRAPLTPSSVVLRRFRIADKAHETKKRGERRPIDVLREAAATGDFEKVKRIIEVTLTDAFYREYVMGLELLAVWVFRDTRIEEDVFWLVNRLGDTESLCTVVDVQKSTGRLTRKREVETPFPAPLTPGALVVEGVYTPAKLSDERRRLRPFAIPVHSAVEARGKRRYRVFRPSSVRIRYSEDVDVCETPWGDVVLG